ncbi:unnamed protein product, partial [Mesorhabditis belari]|uniref:UPAR/Ly6 domain-containing protein n=1 Tax=Mesorhabditis belari TaxID=2138241 RepID=A0AAF3EB55_9BILA
MWFLLVLLSGCSALKCWRCVGPDCGNVKGPSAQLVECPTGSQCQVNQLEFYDMRLNQTRIQIPVRSCSYETGCVASLDASHCEMIPNEFAGMGCSRTKCCVEDGCNSASSLTALLPSLFVVGILFVIHSQA